MKKYKYPVSISIFLLLTSLADANDVVSETEHNCKFSGCQIKCANKKGEWKTVGAAKKVKISIYNSGVTKLILDNGFDGVQTLVMGGNGYICSIENQHD